MDDAAGFLREEHESFSLVLNSGPSCMVIGPMRLNEVSSGVRDQFVSHFDEIMDYRVERTQVGLPVPFINVTSLVSCLNSVVRRTYLLEELASHILRPFGCVVWQQSSASLVRDNLNYSGLQEATECTTSSLYMQPET